MEIVIAGMRNSWESHGKSDSKWVAGSYYEEDETFTFGNADKTLALKLITAGADHGKFMRQLPVVVDLTAPELFLKQLDTYKVGTTKNSTSTMHTLGRVPITADMFAGNVSRETIDKLNALRDAWVAAGKRKGGGEQEWQNLLDELPMSFAYRSCWSANYQVLRNIYHARKHHRLGDWKPFCQWIESLPYADLITYSKKDTNNA